MSMCWGVSRCVVCLSVGVSLGVLYVYLLVYL